jgi:hypothetical protein
VATPSHQEENSELSTNEEQTPGLQGDVVKVGELTEFLQSHPSMHVHSAAIFRSLRQGKLGAFKTGSGWVFRRDAIDRLIQRTSSRRFGS